MIEEREGEKTYFYYVVKLIITSQRSFLQWNCSQVQDKHCQCIALDRAHSRFYLDTAYTVDLQRKLHKLSQTTENIHIGALTNADTFDTSSVENTIQNV